MEKSFITDLKKYLISPKKIVILPHRNADGDALGSTLAWYHFLSQKGHEAVVISPNEYPSFLKWLPGENKILKYTQNPSEVQEKIRHADMIFTLDFNALDRIQELTDIVSKAPGHKIMIDHHEAPEDYAVLRYSDTSMSSTCEMIYNVIKALDETAINKEIASCLYTGIMTDTGSFRYSATTSETHQAISHLIQAGADGTEIHQKIYDSASFNRLKLLGITLSNLQQFPDLPIVFMTLNQEELISCDYQKGDTEGFVNYGLSLEGIVFSCILIENKNEGKIKMSFRSKGTFSVNDFARTYFNGGGHHNAAGGMSMDSMEDTVARFKNAVKEVADQFQ
ncbi:DHH family phosphoesterase [Flavobacteriaceae bacterium]|jgi:phosphoesterase RecJ-like protein|nr:DHH family phosphoesterase [Flavobacteriaceae bacterium]MDA8644022.1 DHH family phosphoesterase [Flavobacteriaceae bacterium]MDC3240826.1 DHH family phosphoesterase [Flavobacteriaceae bacterium]